MSTMTIDQLFDTRAGVAATARPERSSAAEKRSSVRLTRRGRVVVFVVGLLALLGAGLLISNAAGAASQAGTPESTHTVVVAPGDTLWDLAAAASDSSDDVRAMIDHIEKINGLSGASLSAGQSLRIPN